MSRRFERQEASEASKDSSSATNLYVELVQGNKV